MGAQTSITQSQTSNERPLHYITPQGKIYTTEINRNQRHIFMQLYVHQGWGLVCVWPSVCHSVSVSDGVKSQGCIYSSVLVLIQPSQGCLFDGLTLFLSEVEKCAVLAIQHHLDLLCSLIWNKRRERMCECDCESVCVCVSMGKMSLWVYVFKESINCCCFFLHQFAFNKRVQT